MKQRSIVSISCNPGKLVVSAFFLVGMSCSVFGNALEEYVARPDACYRWQKLEQTKGAGFTITHLELVSQRWRESNWTHHIQVVRPEKVLHPEIAFLLISGDGGGTGELGLLKTLAQRAGAVAAVVTRVPNQPRYGERREDALISYTFLKYLETGDETWPLLLPMTKSAVRAMDAIQAFAAQENNQQITKFVVSGASKRGWTTYLTAAVDSRVQAMAPMVIDMLNMKVQLDWMKKVYGRHSEMIRDYTDLKLQERIDDPRMVTLRSWVDPYSYRQRYTMPKLLLLGSNDPYWTVDSLRHYWNDLPEPKLVQVTANAGHGLSSGKDSHPALAAFFELVAAGQPLPKMEWKIGDTGNGKAEVSVHVNQTIKRVQLWTATSPVRDFRKAKWSSSAMIAHGGSATASGKVETPAQGYRAYFAEATLTSPSGHEYKLSTEARVTPDNIK